MAGRSAVGGMPRALFGLADHIRTSVTSGTNVESLKRKEIGIDYIR
jgi:hypothetical protein